MDDDYDDDEHRTTATSSSLPLCYDRVSLGASFLCLQSNCASVESELENDERFSYIYSTMCILVCVCACVQCTSNRLESDTRNSLTTARTRS